MELQVSINSYVTVEEADDYISSLYLSKNEARVAWEKLTDEDKKTALLSSCKSLNTLKYTGKRKYAGQKMEFPRVNSYVAGVYYTRVFDPAHDQGLGGVSASSSDGLDKAKMAQIENALWGVVLDAHITDGAKIGVRGLKSKNAGGKISESYGDASVQAQEGIYTKQVYSILSEWLSSSRYTV